MSFSYRLINSTVTIPCDKQNGAYQAACALNARDDLKRGYPERHFSGMASNYPDVCSDIQEVLQMLGFDVFLDGQDALRFGDFNGKYADEDLFLKALAPYMTNGEIELETDSGQSFFYIFKKGTCISA